MSVEPSGRVAQVEEELARGGAILEAVRLAAERFLDPSRSWEESLPEVLAALARATGVSRVYLFENYAWEDDEVWATQRFEWSAPGVRSIADDPVLAAMPLVGIGFGRWIDLFRRGETVFGLRRDLPEQERVRLAEDETLSIALVPIMVDGEWWGMIGFDECAFERVWTPGDIDGLRAAASTIAAAIHASRAEDALRAREAEYRAVFEATSDGLVISDLDGRLVAANPAFCDMHGYRLEELEGRPATTWVHPDYHELRAEYAAVVASGAEFDTDAMDVRADGSAFPVEIRGTRFMFRGSPHVLGVVRDVTERANARLLLESRVRALSAVAESLTIDQPLATTLAGLCATVVGATEAVACAVQDVDSDGNLRVLGSHGLSPAYVDGLERIWRHGADVPTFRALRDQQTTWLPDARQRRLALPSYAPVHDLLRSASWSGILMIPLDALGRHLGVVNLYYPPGIRPDEDEESFLRAVADQAAAAVENARLFTAAQGTAALQERQRLARELHDSVSQALYGIALGAKTARTLAERDPTKVIEPLDYVLGLAEAGLAEMRALIFELRPEALASEGLVAAVDRQLRALRARHGIAVDARLGGEPDVPLSVKEAFYRIVQEALHNVVKHAGATQVVLELGCHGGMLELDVRDDGAGFDPSGSFPGHLGLQSMRERAEAVGATFALTSSPACGTRLRVRVAPKVEHGR